jgi:type VI secretion system protein ImpK
MAQIAETMAGARTENLALIFQELFTAAIRLRSGRQEVHDAEQFRAQVLQAIRMADQNAKSHGYVDTDIQLGVFAVVAFLDESILNLRQPVFKDWVRKPLQEELFGRHVAGEIFFESLNKLLGRRDSTETADVLEIYYLSMLLGYLGKYSISSRGELRSLMMQTADKIQRIRKTPPDWSPGWALPEETGTLRLDDPWVKRLGWVLAGIGTFAILLFAIYRFLLSSGISTVETLAGGGAR